MNRLRDRLDHSIAPVISKFLHAATAIRSTIGPAIKNQRVTERLVARLCSMD